jgi:hypothetical protein
VNVLVQLLNAMLRLLEVGLLTRPLPYSCSLPCPQGTTCTQWQVVTDPPQPVRNTPWMYIMRCQTPAGILPEGISANEAMCYKVTWPADPTTCDGTVTGVPFRRDTFTMSKMGESGTNPVVPVERLTALFGANAWGLQSSDGDCSYTFQVAPLPNIPADYFTTSGGVCNSDPSDYCLCRDPSLRLDDSTDWVTAGTVPMRASAGPTTAAITPSATSVTAFTGTSLSWKVTITNPDKPCSHLPAPIVGVDDSNVAACSPRGGDRGWYAPNADDNTCELTITCSLSEGDTTLDIPVLGWSGSSPLVSQKIDLTVQASVFAITPGSAGGIQDPAGRPHRGLCLKLCRMIYIGKMNLQQELYRKLSTLVGWGGRGGSGPGGSTVNFCSHFLPWLVFATGTSQELFLTTLMPALAQ